MCAGVQVWWQRRPTAAQGAAAPSVLVCARGCAKSARLAGRAAARLLCPAGQPAGARVAARHARCCGGCWPARCEHAAPWCTGPVHAPRPPALLGLGPNRAATFTPCSLHKSQVRVSIFDRPLGQPRLAALHAPAHARRPHPFCPRRAHAGASASRTHACAGGRERRDMTHFYMTVHERPICLQCIWRRANTAAAAARVCRLWAGPAAAAARQRGRHPAGGCKPTARRLAPTNEPCLAYAGALAFNLGPGKKTAPCVK